MVQDVMSDWVQKAKAAVGEMPYKDVNVVCRELKPTVGAKIKTQGQAIMEMAEKIWPALMKMFEGVQDENGITLQASHVRGMALNVAQELIKNPEHRK